MNTERKFHSGLLSALCLLAAVLIISFHTRPAQTEKQALLEKQRALEDEVKVFSGEKDIGSIADVSEVEQKELAMAIPVSIEQDAIINDLSRIAKMADVSFNGLTFSLDKRDELNAVNISAGFQGPGPNIIRFLKFIESNRRTFVIKDASVSHVETGGGIDLVTLQITIQAFYRNDSV